VTEIMGEEFEFAGCQPYHQVVMIPNDSPNVFLTPSCISVKRCGGCCLDDSRVCEPISTSDIYVKVRILIEKSCSLVSL